MQSLLVMNSELLDRKMYLFGDEAPGQVTLWIRDTDGAGPVAVPCQVDDLATVLKGATYHVEAPGVDCALRQRDESVDVELQRPGGVLAVWSIPQKRFQSALQALTLGVVSHA